MFLANISAIFDPTRFSDTVHNPKWRATIKTDINALKANGTWELTFLPMEKELSGANGCIR